MLPRKQLDRPLIGRLPLNFDPQKQPPTNIPSKKTKSNIKLNDSNNPNNTNSSQHIDQSKIIEKQYKKIQNEYSINFVEMTEDLKKEKKKLGSGGFGIVYLGEYQKSDVAIKKIQIKNEKALSAGMQEINKMIKVGHPKIIRFLKFSIDHHEHKLYIIMEKQQGDLNNYDFKNFQVKLLVIRQIAEGLYNLNKNKIIHRDIKPENILYDKSGGIKITDFGIAKIGFENQKSSGKCTPCYAAREVYIDKEPHEKSDIWSFGLLIYWIITKRSPWQRNQDLIAQGLRNYIFPLEEDWKQAVDAKCQKFSQEIKEIIQSCLRYDHKARSSISELIQKLQSIGLKN